MFDRRSLRPTLDDRFLSCLRSTRGTAEDRQKVGSLKLCLKKIEEFIALTLKEGIALTLDSRLSANFRQKRGKAKAERRKSKLELPV